MKNGFQIMDSDFHVMEPSDLWERYLEDEWKSQAPKFVQNPRFPASSPGIVVQSKAIPAAKNDEMAVRTRSDLHMRMRARSSHYDLARERGFDPVTHLMAMDIEGVDVGVLYSTRGRHVISHDDLEPHYAAALCRAYNNWLYDYVQTNPQRMKIAAQVSFHDAELAAEEARRAVTELGAVAIVGTPNPVNGHHVHDHFFDPLWKELERLGIPVGVHPTGVSSLRHDIGQRFLHHPAYSPISHSVRNPAEGMFTLASLTTGGVLERFPNLTVAILESTCGWLPWLLWRLDEQWEKFGPGCDVKLSAKPSEYFFRNCYIATDVDEESLRIVINELGDDRIVVSTDYPHDDSLFPQATDAFLGLKGVSDDSKRKILWDNCARLYKLPKPERSGDTKIESNAS